LRAASRSYGTWKDNDFDVLEDGVVVGLIFFLDAVGPQDRPLDVGEQSQRRHTPRRARLRADARGRDGGVREESVQGVKGVGRPSDASIQNRSSRLLISRDFLPESGTTRDFRDALSDKRFSGTSGTTGQLGRGA